MVKKLGSFDDDYSVVSIITRVQVKIKVNFQYNRNVRYGIM